MAVMCYAYYITSWRSEGEKQGGTGTVNEENRIGIK